MVKHTKKEKDKGLLKSKGLSGPKTPTISRGTARREEIQKRDPNIKVSPRDPGKSSRIIQEGTKTPESLPAFTIREKDLVDAPVKYDPETFDVISGTLGKSEEQKEGFLDRPGALTGLSLKEKLNVASTITPGGGAPRVLQAAGTAATTEVAKQLTLKEAQVGLKLISAGVPELSITPTVIRNFIKTGQVVTGQAIKGFGTDATGKLVTGNFLKKGVIGLSGQAFKANLKGLPGRLSVNPKSEALVGEILSKFFSNKALLFYASWAGSVFMGGWGKAESPEPLLITQKELFREAKETGDWTFYNEAKAARIEILDINTWEKIGLFSPLSPLVGNRLKAIGGIEGGIALDKLAARTEAKQDTEDFKQKAEEDKFLREDRLAGAKERTERRNK